MFIVLLAFSICGMGCFLLGAFLVHLSGSTSILSPFQWQTFPLEAYIYLVTMPSVWVYYVKEPQRIAAIFDGLMKNRVIKESGKHTVEKFLDEQLKYFQSPWFTFAALGLTMAVFLFWSKCCFYARQPFLVFEA